MKLNLGNETVEPSKILCLGRNYLDHIKETNAKVPEEPVIFPKTPNCLIKNGEEIIYPRYLYYSEVYNRIDHEVELAFIIDKRAKNIPKEHAYEYIFGYTVFNDVTARKMQAIDREKRFPWFRSKSFDTFGPILEDIVPKTEIEDPHNLKIELKVNDEIKQSSNTKHLLFKIPEILEFVSQFFTLERGDIIATGTPSGISPLSPGDIVEATIKNIGILKNPVILEE